MTRAYNVNRIGMEFGHWTVVSDAGYRGTNRYYVCVCVCGKPQEISLANLMSGRTKSCLCEGRKVIAEKKTTHGMRYTRPNKIWRDMLQRCNNPRNSNFQNYGGRGIMVCEEWHTFENFWRDMEKDYRDNLTLERIDNNEGYCAENCTWIPLADQSGNRRPSSEWNYA